MKVLDKIKELIDKENITIYELSKRSGVPQSTLTNLFIRYNNPSISTLEQICKGLNITLSEFFNDGDEIDLTSEEKRVIEKYKKLSKEQKDAIVNIMDLF